MSQQQPSPARVMLLKSPEFIRRAKQQAKKEFRDWKATLKRVIDQESELLFDEKTGTWSFNLPGTVTQLVVETLIRARVRLDRDPNKQRELHRALTQLRHELDLAVSAVRGEEDGAKAVDVEAEEREAKNVLAQMRAELVKSMDGDDGASD